MSIHEDIPISTTVTVEEEFLPGGKKKSHNLIEKKYRTSINDRIGVLRNIVSRHFKDDKKVCLRNLATIVHACRLSLNVCLLGLEASVLSCYILLLEGQISTRSHNVHER